MHLLGSASLRVQKNVAAKSLCASESRWAVGFENGTVNVLDNQGILQFKVKSPTDRSESNFGEKLPLNAIAIADSRRLLISWGRDEFLHGYDLMNGYVTFLLIEFFGFQFINSPHVQRNYCQTLRFFETDTDRKQRGSFE